MISIDEFRTGPEGGYSCTIMGSEGEDELIIIMSPSQARKTPLIIVAASVDGGGSVLLSEEFVDYPMAKQLLIETMRTWTRTGIQPTEIEAKRLELRINHMADVICKHYYID